MRNEERGTRNEAAGSIDAPSRGFRGLIAWQRADELASAVFRAIRPVARTERWLANQAIRAAISVPANIAEGYSRRSIGDYLRFLDIARGSLAELEYYLHFLAREELLANEQIEPLQKSADETGRLLGGLWKALKQKAADGDWDRSGVVREEQVEYEADLSAPRSSFPIPRS